MFRVRTGIIGQELGEWGALWARTGICAKRKGGSAPHSPSSTDTTFARSAMAGEHPAYPSAQAAICAKRKGGSAPYSLSSTDTTFARSAKVGSPLRAEVYFSLQAALARANTTLRCSRSALVRSTSTRSPTGRSSPSTGAIIAGSESIMCPLCSLASNMTPE